MDVFASAVTETLLRVDVVDVPVTGTETLDSATTVTSPTCPVASAPSTETIIRSNPQDP